MDEHEEHELLDDEDEVLEGQLQDERYTIK